MLAKYPWKVLREMNKSSNHLGKYYLMDDEKVNSLKPGGNKKVRHT